VYLFVDGTFSWWIGIMVTHWVESTKLLYGGPG